MLRQTCIFSVLLFGLCCGTDAWSQGYEVGGGLGAYNYIGDLQRGLHLNTLRPAGTLFVRYNFNNAVSFRTGVTFGQMIGWDEKTPIDVAAEIRDLSFDILVLEASGVVEYHFLNWREEGYPIRWTPYFFAGFGMFGILKNSNKPEDYSDVQPAIPFGAGVKYILNPRWYVGFEVGARKTFTDYLDNVSGGDGSTKNYQYGNPHDNDMYYYGGFTINYSFYSIPCPVSPYRKRYQRN